MVKDSVDAQALKGVEMWVEVWMINRAGSASWIGGPKNKNCQFKYVN